jgi:hypothetical protein
VCDRGAPPGPLLPGVRAHLWAPGWLGWAAEQGQGRTWDIWERSAGQSILTLPSAEPSA